MVRRGSTPTRNESGMLCRERATESADWLTRARQGRREQEERAARAAARSRRLRQYSAAQSDARLQAYETRARTPLLDRGPRERERPRFEKRWETTCRARTATTPKTTRIIEEAPSVFPSTYARPSARPFRTIVRAADPFRRPAVTIFGVFPPRGSIYLRECVSALVRW